MAKVVYGPIVSDARNKVGGSVFTKGRSGAVVRRKVSPCQPRTSYQMNVRSSFTAISKLWSDPTMDANRAGWISLAERTPIKDTFGANFILTGLQMFQRVNRALHAIGVATLLVAPLNLVAGAPGTIELTATAATNTTVLTWPTAPAATEVPVVFAAPPQNAGRKSIGGKCRQIAYLGAAYPGPWTSTTHYYNKFGSWLAGQRIFFQLLFVSNVNGAQGGRSSVSCISG